MVIVNKVNLADDIIQTNILTRLPVKALIRFRAVCKSWYSLLSDACFTNMHKQIRKNRKNNLLLVNYGDDKDLAVIDHCWRKIFPSFVDTSDFSNKWVAMVGCCEDIVCVYGTDAYGPDRDEPFGLSYSDKVTTDHISLWNPALRINKTIAIYMQPPWYCGVYRDICIGFGYHKQTNDYKVIKFTNTLCRIEDVMIYSSNSNTWRKIELYANEITDGRIERYGVYVSCCLYWSVESLKGCQIISFHMKDEVFRDINLPISVPFGCNRKIRLFNYDDSLALLHLGFSYSGSYICDIWVMTEYNNHKLWTKLCEFETDWDASFVGVMKPELMICSFMKKHLNVVDINESEMKTERSIKELRFLEEARQVTSFTESLALLPNKKL